MTVRRMTVSDTDAILAFYETHIDRAMFPMENLRKWGLSSQHATPPARSVEGWLVENNGRIQGAVSVTHEGAIMPVLPDGAEDIWTNLKIWLTDRDIIGVLGEAQQVRIGLNKLGLTGAPSKVDRDEPHYALCSDALSPAHLADRRLVPCSQVPRDLLVEWRAAYGREVLGMADANEASRDIDAYLERDSHRVLIDQDTPVAMTGFNATNAECVQIGGVYTPVRFRGRGYASQALSLHLQEAFGAGVKRATLFAASAKAARIYERLGFTNIGEYALVIFETPERVTS